ncbi:MAG: oligopeptidase B, partial [Bacteroidota bacterium]
MRTCSLSTFGAVVLLAACTGKTAQTDMPQAPVARKIPHEITLHGDTRIDNYYWMRLSDEQKNAAEPDSQAREVLDYLHAENAYTKAMLAHTDSFQVKLFEEMKGRIKETDQSVPVKNRGYWYYVRYEQGQDYAYYCRKKESLETGAEEVLVDGPALAKGKEYWALGDYSVSEDNRLMCYSVDELSRRIYTIFIRDLSTGKLLEDRLEGTGG